MTKLNFIDRVLTAISNRLPTGGQVRLHVALWKTLRPFGLEVMMTKETEIVEKDDGCSEIVEIARFVHIRRHRELVSS